MRDKIILAGFALLIIYGTYIESMKQYHLYTYNRTLLEQGTLTQTDDFYRTGMNGDVVGFEYQELQTKTWQHGATYNTGNVGEILKRDMIPIIYRYNTLSEHYDAKYYDQLLKEMKPWHILLHSLFYVVLVLSVMVPVVAINRVLLRRKLQLLKQINAKLGDGRYL